MIPPVPSFQLNRLPRLSLPFIRIAFLFGFGFFNAQLSGKTVFVDGQASGQETGESWQDAYSLLQDALLETESGDEVRIAEGTYYPDEGIGQIENEVTSSFVIAGGVAVMGGFPSGGGEQDPTSHPVILSGDLGQDDVVLSFGDRLEYARNSSSFRLERNGTNSWSVVTLDLEAGSQCLLDGITITGGNADGSFDSQEEPEGSFTGAGIYNLNATGITILRNCRIANNDASISGGGYGGGGILSVFQCLFASNSGTSGGGISARTVFVSDSEFRWNLGFEDGGGGISAGEVQATNTLFDSNDSCQGGAIRCGLGTIEQCQFLSNSATEGGSAIRGTTLRVSSCLFSGNTNSIRQAGGVIAAVDESRFSNCLFSGNFSNNSQTFRFGDNCDINFCTFSGNRTFRSRGLIHAGTHFSMRNSIIWDQLNEEPDEDETLIEFEGTPMFLFCLIQGVGVEGIENTNGGGFLDGTPSGSPPGFRISLNPQNAPALGGDFRLLEGSPALDVTFDRRSLDLAGSEGLIGPDADLGAYEGAFDDPDLDDDGISNDFELLFSGSETGLEPESDLDGDGNSVLEEFALGLTPGVADANPLHCQITSIEGERYMEFGWRIREEAAPLVNYLPEWNRNLPGGWMSSNNLLPVGVEDGVQVLRERFPIAPDSQRFYRLRIEKK